MMVVVKKIADPLQNACNLMSKIGMHIHNNINRIACKIEYSKIDEVIKYIYNMIAGRYIIFSLLHFTCGHNLCRNYNFL